MEQKISAVIFDCFGVLTNDKWKEFVNSLPIDQQADARDLNRALDRGVINHQEFYDQVHKLTGREVQFVESLINSEMHKNQELLKYIAELKQKYKLAVLSNVSTNWIREQFLSSEETKLFDVFILSYEVGLVKPDPEIFKLTAERLGVEASQCLFVDDSPYNVQVAVQQGMSGIVYDNFAKFKSEADKLLSL